MAVWTPIDRTASRHQNNLSRSKYDNLQEPEWFLAKMKDFFGQISLINFPFNPDQEGLFRDASVGDTVFCVPPFSQAAKYLEASLDTVRAFPERRVALLISARTEAYSWHDHVFGKATVLFLKGPFRFVGLDKGISAALVIYGDCPDSLIKRLTEMGTVISP
jgi:hypothetical protein